MNKTAIKNFAVRARVQLIESAKQRAFEYEITENGENKANVDSIGGRVLTNEEKRQRRQLIEQIRQKGYTQVMEEVAYTWFNRFVALRFMEVNGYLPSKIRVFTDENNAFKPEILKEAMSVELEGLDKNKVLNLIDKQDNEELYKYLLITQCNALNAGLPYMFEKIANPTELLFPANLLRNDSVIGQMISEIPEEDWTDQVQIIGWMYQYYNSELKDDTFALLKKNVKITKERIPAATQLFTPDWIVRYMVENSLGRLWYEGHNDFDKSQWKYYLDEAEQEPDVDRQLKKIRAEYATIKPEEIKVIDPCMGSGHILVYAFDVLMQIYTSAGWSERDAAKSIIENNLFGLDIDDRAGQLSYFAVMMKARKYSRRILNGETKPNVLSIQDSSWMTDEFIAYAAGKNKVLEADLITLKNVFTDAKEYGSIISVPMLHFDELYERMDIIRRSYVGDLFEAQYQSMTAELLYPLVKQAQVMAQKYDVVVTNPPYMGASNMNPKLNEFIKNKYADYKSDFFSAFVVHASEMTTSNGYCGFFTPYVWMFIQSYEKLRQYLYNQATIETLIQFEYSAFEEATVPVCTFAFSNSHVAGKKGNYLRLVDFRGGMEVQRQKTLEAIADHNCGYYYEQTTDNFSKIPGSPVAYWVSERMIDAFVNGKPLGSLASVPKGLSTGSVEMFMRHWYEPAFSNITFNTTDCKETLNSTKWYPYAKGGVFRKWDGNLEYVVNWENDGYSVKHFVDENGKQRSRPQNTTYYFKKCLTYSAITSYKLSLRYLDKAIFGGGGDSVHITNEELFNYIFGFINSILQEELLKIISPTINFEVDHLKKLPIIIDNSSIQLINDFVEQNISLSRTDWDSYETSWDFKRHPLVKRVESEEWSVELGERNNNSTLHSQHSTLKMQYEAWKEECESRFLQLKKNEEELNRIFISIYGLQDELTPDVADKDVTVHRVFDTRDDVPDSMRNDEGKIVSNYVRTMRDEVVSLISYAVGCMFGRYSLDVDGLAYAGGEWDSSKYQTFLPDKDNIIPICDDDYFDDDIVGKFIDFVRKVYGDETLEENLRFIADALGGKGTPREVIRSYFLNDFYADHLKTYQKRPIYWQFDSGKKNGFKALIYMHRYQPDLLARMRTDYVHEQQERYRTQLQMLEDSAQTAAPSERVKLNKQITKLKDQSLEIQKYEEKIHHLADRMIEIDLDDGVKVNYAKFEDVLAKIK